MRRLAHGDPRPSFRDNMRRCKLRNEAVQIEIREAVQIEMRDGSISKKIRPGVRRQEAVQIETQARVNQDPFISHLPATAWPRQMLAIMYATQNHLTMGVGRGDYDPTPAGPRG